jgi:signal peptidase I
MLFVIVRTLILEPFGVPTGSMAGTLLGNHREIACPRCGHPVIVGEFPNERRNPYAHATCPNCGQRDIDLRRTFDLPGDRLLVDKVVYAFRDPLRWEVAVFRCPVDDSTPYVKRVVGLPGESVQILGGDIFVDGEILRKTFDEWKAMAVPVFDATFAPGDGWRERFTVVPESQPGLPRVAADAGRPLTEAEFVDGTLKLESAEPRTVAFRNRNIETGRDQTYRDTVAYNAGTGVGQAETVHDFAVSCELVWSKGTVTLQVTDGFDGPTLTFDGKSLTLDRGGGYDPLKIPLALTPSSPLPIEFAFVDRTVHVAVAGKPYLQDVPYPADPTNHGQRPGIDSPLRFSVRDGAVEFRKLKLTRDVHYRRDGRNGIDAPFRLGNDDYFVLGDNSANSRDSRVWKIAGVPRGDFLGKPFVIHQAMRSQPLTINGQDRSYPTLDGQRLRRLR